MASSKVQELKSTLGLGARANKYRVMLAAPVGPKDDKKIDTLCKGGPIPAKSIGQIEVWTQGRKLIIAGDAAYENTWSLTFYNTQDHELRKLFDDWLVFIDDMENHKRKVTTNASYMTETAQIQQLDTRDNSVKLTYQFRNLWPTNISSIDMADESNDMVTEFTVDFAFTHWIKM